MSEKTLPLAITGAVAVVGLGMAAIAFAMHQFNNELKGFQAEVSALNATVIELQDQRRSDEGLSARINELDVGMLAMAKMLRLDGVELSRLMREELAGPQALPMPSVTSDAPALQLSAPIKAQASAVETEGTNTDAAEELVGAQPVPTMADIDGILVKRISGNWNMPTGDIADLRAELRLNLSRDGEMESVDVLQSSGNQFFDDSAVSAIMRIQPIAEVARLPADVYQRGYVNRSIVFTPEIANN